MRKRAQRKSRLVTYEPKHIVHKTNIGKKTSPDVKKNWWVVVSLVSIFLLVLFLNSYFNAGVSINDEGKDFSKFYLSGPDPYYNMRLINHTLYGDNPGHYPFYSNHDPILNYPIGRSGGRAPLFNMMAIGFGRLLTPFMNEIDAVGYSMQFLPALYGALIIFPVYFIGKILFNKKAALMGALFLAIIPIHLGSGHGSAYSLFDHDSFNLMLYYLTFMFLIKGVREKDKTKSVLYALLGGIPLAALSMTWVEARYLYTLIAGYAVVQMVIDIVTSKIEPRVFRTISIVMLSGYLISLPVIMSKGGFRPDIPLYLCLGVIILGVVYYIFSKKKIPWTLSLPAALCIGIIGLVFLYFIKDISSSIPLFSSLSGLSNILYGSGIYGNKVSMTIAEAGTYKISRTVMSFGPVIYWLGWAGFVFLIYRYYKNPKRREYLFVIAVFFIQMWLTTVAGRFLNDLSPAIALLGGWIVYVVVDKIDYKHMLRTIRSAGGGIHGLKKGMNIIHISGILFVVFLVIFPNVYLSFDAAVPLTEKKEFFGDLPSGAFGLTHGKEAYWVDAYNWLNKQDANISNPVERPAFISWWDYGFYESAVGGHPTVADNFQDGIPAAANFETATTEKEAVTVWITRLLDGDAINNNGVLSDNVILTLEQYVGVNDTSNITKWVENPEASPSYGTPIGEKYDENLSKQYPVGQQWPMNAVYHDISKLLDDKLDDEKITWLYHDIQKDTGYSIRYYGVEGYDKQIFNIFGFLADKSLLLVAGGGVYNPEDDFEYVKFVTKSNKELTYEELRGLTDTQLRQDPPVNTKPYYKDAYFDTMFYKTYVGLSTTDRSGSKTEPEYQLPCTDMRHFYAEFISNISKFAYYKGQSAVVIAKYYAGAYVNGSITFMGALVKTEAGQPVKAEVVVQKNITQYGTSIPIDHDRYAASDGNFSVIAPAGDITLQIRRYPELGMRAFILKNVTFNDHEGSELAPITDDEAMRRGGDYNRFINISIEPANISGYVYVDKDNDSAFNASVDEPISDANVILIGVNKINSSNGQPEQYDYSMYRELTTNESGYYNTSGLMPGYYRMMTTVDDFLIDDTLLSLYSGNTSHNISKPKPAAVKGKVYFDENKNSQYDPGEEMSDVDVKLLYPTLMGTKKLVDSTVTDQNGNYSFSSLVPGSYNITATKNNDYSTEQTVKLTENKTTTSNVSISYKLIVVSGYTKHENENIGGVQIAFLPDASVENNTAQQILTSSNESGSYITRLVPGSYNVTIHYTGNLGVYSFDGNLSLSIGEGTKTYDILMEKHSFTVTGVTKYEGAGKGNITIDFSPDVSVGNNTAVANKAVTSETGSYTVELMPGSYNVSVDEQVTESGQNVTYMFTGSLMVQSDRSFDISLTRK